MRPMVLALIVSGVAAPHFVAAQSRAPALSTEAIVARYIGARGGLPAIKAIRTLKMTGTMRPGGFDAQLRYVETVDRPGSVRIDATLQGLTLVQSYNGSTGWQIQPFQGRKDPEDVSADDAKSLAEEADFDTPADRRRGQGGHDRESRRHRHRQRAGLCAARQAQERRRRDVVYRPGRLSFRSGWSTHQRVRGSDVYTQTDYGDYETVNGVYFPFEIASGPKGSTVQQRVTYGLRGRQRAGGRRVLRPACSSGCQLRRRSIAGGQEAACGGGGAEGGSARHPAGEAGQIG